MFEMVGMLLGLQVAAGNLDARSMSYGGHQRQWHEFVPANCARRRSACPVAIVLHGGGGRSGDQFARNVGLADEAARRGYILLAPTALEENWNDGRPEIAPNVDDVGFVRALLADLKSRAGVDERRIFATGASNGGLMSYRLACDMAGEIRAVAPVIANLGEALARECRPAAPISVFMIPGTEDRLMPYEGGFVARFGRRHCGRVISSDDSLAFWRRANGCGNPAQTEQADPVRDGTSVIKTRFDRCRGDAVVQRWAVVGGGHTWPGA